jgi:cytidylate kinase
MIITVSRQFGSGGREVGKRLADELGLQYYDRELLAEIAKQTDLKEDYVSYVIEKGGYHSYMFSFAHSMPLVSSTPTVVTDVLVAQRNIIKEVAKKGNCVIVGRSADAIISEYNPFKIFVYADEKSKLARCRERAPKNENLTDKQMLKEFKQIDKARRNLHDLFSSTPWGDKDGYDLMLNTSNTNIKAIIPALAEYIKAYKKQ